MQSSDWDNANLWMAVVATNGRKCSIHILPMMGCGMAVESPVKIGGWLCAGLATDSPDHS